jgi:predicted acetyltransferase
MIQEQNFELLKSIFDDNLEQEMYLAFRETVDRLCFPDLRKWSVDSDGYRLIMYDGKPVGFLMVIDKYVNGIYVMPEHRRKGLARKAVMQFIADGGEIETLHIVRGNNTAQAFWKSLFKLKKIDSCPTDTLYRVVGLREKR